MPASTSFPPFSWSHTRDSAFKACRRRYYWRYYGSQGGWHWAADPEAKRAYRLKQLSTLPMAVGTAVHNAAREIAARVRDQRGMPTLSYLHRRVRDELNQVWLSSSGRGGPSTRPAGGTALRELYYNDPSLRRAVVEARRTARVCLGHLLSCSVWDELRHCDLDTILLFDDPIQARIEGTVVYAVPDLVYRRGRDVGVIVDYKTGGARGRGLLDQLAVYALCLDRACGVSDITDWRARLCFLSDGVEIEYRLTSRHLEQALRRIRKSTARMQSYLADPASNVPKPKDAFPLTSVRDRCAQCSFLELCAPELGADAAREQHPRAAG